MVPYSASSPASSRSSPGRYTARIQDSPKTYRLELEPRTTTAAAPSEAAIAAYYAATCPPGGPPLAAIRDHVIAAMQAAMPGEDREQREADAIDLHALYALDEDLAARPSQLAGPRWLDAAELRAALGAIVDALALVAPADVREPLRGELAALQALVERSARRGRLVVVARPMSLDAQLAALARGGIAPRDGTPRDALTRNWSADEIAAEPWRRLDDALERIDGLGGVALKSIETRDDRGIYGAIAAQIAQLAGGRLPLEDIASDVDFARQTAALAFTLDGVRHELAPRWSGAWFDVAVLATLASLLRARATDWALYHLLPDPMSEGMILAVLSRDDALRLRAAGVPITAL